MVPGTQRVLKQCVSTPLPQVMTALCCLSRD